MNAQDEENEETPLRPTIGWQQADWLALLLIAAAYALGIWLMPLAHNFAVVDDWDYVRTVQHIISTGQYVPGLNTQATLISHAYWGAGFALIFGYSFSSLTVANLLMSFSGAITFYLLLRRLGFAVAISGLGVAILVLTPSYLSLSYSFMTDITFLTLMLLSSLLYINGLEDGGEGWLWLGGLVAALAFLTRQFGLAMPLTALLYLGYAGKLNLRRTLAVALLPMLVTVAYFIWRAAFPAGIGNRLQQELISGWLHDPLGTLAGQSLILLTSIPALGLAIPLFYRLGSRVVAIVWLAILGVGVYLLGQAHVSRSQQIDLRADPIFGQPFQIDRTATWWLAVVLAALVLAWLSERTWHWFVTLRPRRSLRPTDFLYLLTFILAVGTFFTSYFGFLERYQLTLYPTIIIAGLYSLRYAPRWRWVLTLATLAIIATYSINLHLDDFDFYTAQWQAADSAMQQGASYDRLDAGYAWDGYYFFDEAAQRLGSSELALTMFPPDKALDREYLISIHPKPGYRVLAQFPYFSRLDGWTTHQIMVLQRE